jgi:hypothetical protein
MEALNKLYNNKIEELRAYDTELKSIADDMKQLHANILNERAQNPAATAEDLKPMFVEYRQLFVKSHLRFTASTGVISEMVALKEALAAANVKPEADDKEYEKYLNAFVLSGQKQYVVSGGKLIPQQEEQEVGLLEEVAKSFDNPEQLDAMFNSPEFQPIVK